MKLSQEQEAKLKAPLPSEAINQHPSKTFLSTICDIYVIERLNEVFGVGAWKLKVEHVTTQGKMVVVKVLFTIPEYNIEYECYGGNDNSDLGDAYKGATTDALTKICSWLGIANEVWKTKKNKTSPAAPKTTTKPQSRSKQTLTTDMIMDEQLLSSIIGWLHKHTQGNNIERFIRNYYNVDEDTLRCISNEYHRLYG